jgi:hypothetical protein
MQVTKCLLCSGMLLHNTLLPASQSSKLHKYNVTLIVVCVATRHLCISVPLQDVLLQANPDSLPLGSPPPQQLDPASFAALTASSNLHTLRLQGAELPQGAWQHVFPPKRQLQQLRELWLGHASPSLGDETLEHLVSCCPGLCVLNLSRVLHSSASLAPLLRLPQLQDLELKHIHGDSGARVLAQLTGLRRLVNDDANLSPAGLMRLTALTGLRELLMHYSADAWSLPRQVCLHNKVRWQSVGP